MNITHLLSTSSLNNYVNTRYLYHEESKLGHMLNLISYDKNLTRKRININNNFYVNYIDGKIVCNNFLFKNNPIIYNLEHYVNMFNSDIIHSHIFFTYFTYKAAQLHKKFNIPLIISIHGSIAPLGFIKEELQKIYYLSIGRYIFKNTNLIRCLSRYDATQIMKYGCPKNKIVVIPNGVDSNKFKPVKKYIENNSILWTGRLVKGKGLEMLVHSIKILSNKIHDIKLVIVGDGPLKTTLYSMVKNNKLKNHVIFMGKVPHDNIPEILNKIEIFVYPSIREGMPYSILEAMSCGKPVITSNMPGIKELIKNETNGIIFKKYNPFSLAQSIEKLLQDKELGAQIGLEARLNVCTNFDWKFIAKKMTNSYNKLIN